MTDKPEAPKPPATRTTGDSVGSNRLGAAVDGTKKNAEGIGYGVAVLLPWITADLMGWEIPPEVLAVMAAFVTSIAVRLKERI